MIDSPPNPNTPHNWNARWSQVYVPYKSDAWVKLRLTLIASLIPPPSSVLDVAAGPGSLKAYLHPSIRYIPLDFSRTAIHTAPKPSIIADCLHLPVKPRSFTHALALEIIEHLDNPTDFIVALAHIATQAVLFSTPNNRFPPADCPYHRTVYTQATLHQYLASTLPHARVRLFTSPGSLIAQCNLKDS